MIVPALSQAKKPLIISGSHAGSEEVIKAAANIAFALKPRGAKLVSLMWQMMPIAWGWR